LPYSTEYRRWRSGRCRLQINGFDVPTIWATLAKKAIRAWNSAGARFEFVVDDRSQSSLICIERGGNAWVGLTTLRPLEEQDPYIAMVLIEIDTTYPFVPPHPTTKPTRPGGPYDLYSVLLHELGHALHLGEDYGIDSNTVMRPTINPGEKRSLAADDISAIKLLYP
jgi:predicted Zn-dependent protease